ncbi:hypothetical protein M4578_15875 [Salipiger sp. P9]|uniref:DUF6636 domain-containing protein n=1 Tax=Salipiger pentaromativorans TaxID=2943193 RepID=UPI0021584B79|nr:DUF6636 domain-containing protein [Salipiger pentaromativorans]MCR8549309.1 hypothetical protein [Salipiger pentaromativorans]
MFRSLLLAGLCLAGPAMADVSPFRTPSDNIRCWVGTGEGPPDLSCEIVAFTGTPNVARPASCAGPWGHKYVLLARGPATMECGAPVRGKSATGVDVAPYGVSADWGGISCISERTGLTCRNADGHGFLLSRRVLKVW